ncbi:MAG: EmrB/QacA family drug resistance transporter, partial [Acidobacteriales bacterium]|nr:EmrB/QacA family drug resistance transporter [Terriglobales bacterium]
FMLSRISLDVGFWNFWWPLMLQGACLGLIFVPLTTVTNSEVPRERMGNATSLFNLMRNIGASIGISMVETTQFRRMQSHIHDLGKNVTPGNPQAQAMIGNLTAYFKSQGRGAAMATQQAYGAVWGMLQRQASILSYNDVFFILALMFLAMFPFIFLMRKPKPPKGPVMAH